jgi:hypothetical protein
MGDACDNLARNSMVSNMRSILLFYIVVNIQKLF